MKFTTLLISTLMAMGTNAQLHPGPERVTSRISGECVFADIITPITGTHMEDADGVTTAIQFLVGLHTCTGADTESFTVSTSIPLLLHPYLGDWLNLFTPLTCYC